MKLTRLSFKCLLTNATKYRFLPFVFKLHLIVKCHFSDIVCVEMEPQSVQNLDQSEAEENDDVRIIPKLVDQDWMATLHITFANNDAAEIALNTLTPDIEPRVGCYRELTSNGCTFSGKFSAPDPKGLSISLRGFLDHVSLIEACFSRFSPKSMPEQSTKSHICNFSLAKSCEQFSKGDEQFFSCGCFSIESENCVDLSEKIHEYLKVYVEEIAMNSKEK